MLIWLVLCADVGVMYNFGCPVQLWVSCTAVAFLCTGGENLYNLSVLHLPLILAFLASPPSLKPRQLCMTLIVAVSCLMKNGHKRFVCARPYLWLSMKRMATFIHQHTSATQIIYSYSRAGGWTHSGDSVLLKFGIRQICWGAKYQICYHFKVRIWLLLHIVWISLW